MANLSLAPDNRTGEKSCRKCGIVKPLTLFAKDKRSPDSSGAQCRSCCNAANAKWASENKSVVKSMLKDWYKRNTEKVKAQSEAWAKDNPGKRRTSYENWYSKNKDLVAERSTEWALKNPEKVKSKSARYRDKNREKAKADSLMRRLENPDRVREIRRAYKVRHPELTGVENSRRRASKRNAKVSWANQDDIRKVYVEAKKKELETGIAHHVDHIVPLKSDYVCGLHVACNLQVLTAFENISKHNKTWPDMP